MKRSLLSAVSMALLFTAGLGATICAQASNDIPEAALEACSDKEHGDVCSFDNDLGDSIDGSCGYEGGVEAKLVCVPID